MSKLYFKEIPLYPTNYTLDVIVTQNKAKAIKFMKHRYHVKKHKLKRYQVLDTVRTIASGHESILKGEIRIVLILETFDPAILVHELVHVLYRLSDRTGIELNQDSQEWQAIAMERLYNEALERKTYQTFNF